MNLDQTRQGLLTKVDVTSPTGDLSCTNPKVYVGGERDPERNLSKV